MKQAKQKNEVKHPADARRLSFNGLKFEDVIAAMVKIKPEPKKHTKRRKG